MQSSTDLLGTLFALTSALVWGSGDFSGGLATRRDSQFKVLALSALSGISVLLICAVLWGEVLPSLGSMGWATLAGIAGALGLAALYRALSIGRAASTAPTAAVIGVILPILFSIFTQGLPSGNQLAGFALALPGIWLVSRSAAAGGGAAQQGFVLACLAGIGFGCFFILIAQVESGKVFIPLVIARFGTFFIAMLMLRIKRVKLSSITINPIALLAGVLDAGGNVFYLLARQFTRLDVAAVLSSFYPATTVLLATLILKERVSGWQWVGIGFCLAAIMLISI